MFYDVWFLIVGCLTRKHEFVIRDYWTYFIRKRRVSIYFQRFLKIVQNFERNLNTERDDLYQSRSLFVVVGAARRVKSVNLLISFTIEEFSFSSHYYCIAIVIRYTRQDWWRYGPNHAWVEHLLRPRKHYATFLKRE